MKRKGIKQTQLIKILFLTDTTNYVDWESIIGNLQHDLKRTIDQVLNAGSPNVKKVYVFLE